MRTMKAFMIIFLLFITILAGAGEQSEGSADALFRRALEGDVPFDPALTEWAEDIRSNPAPPASLYYNMANALALEGRDDAALALYSKALTLKPGSRDFRYNRNLLLEEKELASPRWSAVEGIIWFPLWLAGYRGMWILLGTVAAAALLYTLISLSGRRIPPLPMILGSVLFLLYGGTVLAGWEYRCSGLAVIRGDEAQLYEGDSPLYPSAAVLGGGEEVRILEERDGWFRIRSTAGNGEGWCDDFSLLRAAEVVSSY